MSKWRMSEIVRQRCRLDYVRIDLFATRFQLSLIPNGEPLGQPPGELCHLKCVRESIVKDVALSRTGDLRYSRKSPESRRIQNAVAVCLLWVAAIGPRVAFWLRGRMTSLLARRS